MSKNYNDENIGSFKTRSILHDKIRLDVKYIGSDIKEILKTILRERIESKCIKEGYVIPNTCDIMSYSAGECDINFIVFHVVYKCVIYKPIKGREIKVVITNKTKAGIRAKTRDPISHIDVFVAREYMSNQITDSIYDDGYKQEDLITVKILGFRYELNDTKISIIADLVE